MRIYLACLLTFLSGCSHLSGSFKDCSRQVAEKHLLETVSDAMNCGEDKSCLEQKAKQDAIAVAADLEQCLPVQGQDGGK